MPSGKDSPLTERILPPPDRFATCPTDGKILEYYAGAFESVYVLLHPFIKAVTIGTEQFRPTTYPDRSLIVKNCAPVSWGEVALQTGLPSISAIDIGLRTVILGLRAELSNTEFADGIESLIDSHQILQPPEGRFSDLLHDSVLRAIQDLGYAWVWIGDEFCTERKLYWMEDLTGGTGKQTEGHINVFTPDKALLWTTHWDSHFSFLCSSRRNLLAIQERYRFEGFFCKPETEVYLSVRP